MLYRQLCLTLVLLAECLAFPDIACSGELLNVWPDLAPGESTKSHGEPLPVRPEEVPAVIRITKITQPSMSIHLAEKPNGSSVVIFPGGAFARVVTNKEGTEIAERLNQHGISAFVLSYRTSDGNASQAWVRPLQDAQRAMSLIRSRAAEWKLKPDQIGIAGFSAGGQLAARLLCDGGRRTYDRIDAVDDVSHRPDFAAMIYPWNLYDPESGRLAKGLEVPADCPPTFLVHTHDDKSTSLGTALFYVGLKQHNIPAELHIYLNGGHGYGLRAIDGSRISTWPDHASHWMNTINGYRP